MTRADATTGVPGSFSGSYDASDITFLLRPVSPAQTERLFEEPAQKERLIQGGHRHYSEMITPERIPEPRYRQIYERSLERHAARMGAEVAQLVCDLDARLAGPITLCSLVRAGVPLGVLLMRGLRARGRDVEHFGVSIIRDRGLDDVALQRVCRTRSPVGVVFVDGWTGKGAIADELERSLTARSRIADLTPRLVVLADPAGRAWLSAGVEDWLIPSGILGGTVSGLVSRSILNASLTSPGDFHATVVLDYLAAYDVSRDFVDRIEIEMRARLTHTGVRSASGRRDERDTIRRTSTAVIDRVAGEFGIDNRNRIKPGIAEATRAVLRRAPDRILVAGENDPDLAGLRHLAREAGVVVEQRGSWLYPYRAITIIADATGGRARSSRTAAYEHEDR